MTMRKISIIGTGYVGLCTGIGFASKGFKVTMSTQSQSKVDDINRAIPPFHEPDLEKLLKEVVKNGHLTCVANREKPVLNTDVTFVAVGTPSQPDGSINLTYIKEASIEIGKAIAKKSSYHLVVVKSTVVPGTTENTVKPLLQEHSIKKCGADFGLCMNPEFLREGSAIHDTLHPDRIVIGEHDKKSGDILQDLFESFYQEEKPAILRTTLPTAELIKYTNNSFLATKISFINQIANMCQRTPNTDITAIARGIGLDHRINPNFLKAGLGYGGSCFPKDVKALIAYSKGLGYTPNLLEAVEDINRDQPYIAVELAKELAGGLKNKRVAILGLSFKPETDDMREAVSTRIIKRLLEEGADIIAYDPVAVPNAKAILGDRIAYAQSASECLDNADCCMIVTEWDEFRELKPEDFMRNMRNPVVIDGRRMYDPQLFSGKLKYAAIGLGKNK
jgi:UDPglucose 6-dehydrogenase